MTSLQRYTCNAALIGLCLAVANGAYAQVNSINSANYHPREYNDVSGSALTVVSNYPSDIRFSDFGVSAPSGFANRDVWRFSNNGGTSAYLFQNNDFFLVSMTLTLTANSLSPRREAGFLFDTAGGQGQFLVNTDGHEIVAFGGRALGDDQPKYLNSPETPIYVKGRVLYNGLGHPNEVWDRPDMQKMMVESVKWVMKMIDGDATPRPRPAR